MGVGGGGGVGRGGSGITTVNNFQKVKLGYVRPKGHELLTNL